MLRKLDFGANILRTELLNVRAQVICHCWHQKMQSIDNLEWDRESSSPAFCYLSQILPPSTHTGGSACRCTQSGKRVPGVWRGSPLSVPSFFSLQKLGSHGPSYPDMSQCLGGFLGFKRNLPHLTLILAVR